MRVFVLDKNKRPLNPTHPARARKLLKSRRAKVFKRFPFTIILQDIEGGQTLVGFPDQERGEVNDCQLKIDPGSKTTGIAIVQGNQIIWGAELTHRGQQIRDTLISRRQLRRGRRSRKTRYRQPRFLNRKRPEGWLAPSLMSRVHNIITWVNRLCRVCPISGISQELVRFDTQALQNPEISGAEYQQGELFGYEVREYLLEKWNRKCAYFGIAVQSFLTPFAVMFGAVFAILCIRWFLFDRLSLSCILNPHIPQPSQKLILLVLSEDRGGLLSFKVIGNIKASQHIISLPHSLFQIITKLLKKRVNKTDYQPFNQKILD